MNSTFLKGKNNFETRAIIFFSFANIFIFLFSCVVFYWLFENLFYTSDGFNIYSVLRNLSEFKGFYEGPIFENYLGAHSSFTLILIAPLIGLFKNPSVLGYLNIFLYLLSSIFIFFISIEYKLSNILSFFFSSIFFLFIFSSNGILTPYHYQIDYLAVPLILLILYSAKKKYKRILYLSIALFILTKEEYIIWTIGLLPLIIYLLNYKIQYVSRKIFYPIIFFFTLSTFSISTLFYFKNINSSNSVWSEVPKNILSFPKLGQMLDLIILPEKGFILWIITSLLIVLFTRNIQKVKNLILFIYGFIFLFLRLYANQIIYGDQNHLQNSVIGQTWATYCLLIPIFYFIIIAQTANIYHQNKSFLESKFISFTLIFIYSIAILMAFNLSIKQIKYHSQINPYGNISELSLLNKQIPLEIKKYGYFLTEKTLLPPFMDRSSVELHHYFPLNSEERKNWLDKIIRNADFAVLDCNSIEILEYLKNTNWVEINNECSKNYKLLLPNKNN